MGLCVDATENRQGLDFEIKKETVSFVLGIDQISYDQSAINKCKYVEIDKAVLAKIVRLCQDKVWHKKIFGRGKKDR